MYFVVKNRNTKKKKKKKKNISPTLTLLTAVKITPGYVLTHGNILKVLVKQQTK
jgi:hypothetical protein